jgi:hypothetical protein
MTAMNGILMFGGSTAVLFDADNRASRREWRSLFQSSRSKLVLLSIGSTSDAYCFIQAP